MRLIDADALNIRLDRQREDLEASITEGNKEFINGVLYGINIAHAIVKNGADFTVTDLALKMAHLEVMAGENNEPYVKLKGVYEVLTGGIEK